MAKVTSAELAQDVDGAEKLLQRHEEHRAEITSRQDAFNRFYATGNDLIRKGHFLGNDIQEKIKTLELRYHLLNETWKNRRILYEQNLDTQVSFISIFFFFWIRNLIFSSILDFQKRSRTA